MDPAKSAHKRARYGLPRTRGDGPHTPRPWTVQGRAPPHTRGWTRLPHQGLRRRGDSPAHAGMDPGRTAPSCAIRGLPRTRGDGPVICRAMDSAIGASPHTRGWTRAKETTTVGVGGSPAHAGMDPSPPGYCSVPARLPRTRGDGPHPPSRGGSAPAAPPHTRGWTPPNPRINGPGTGSPAHAGMDPTHRAPGPSKAGLPRTRGDGPDYRIKVFAAGEAPPHTRGWTRAVRPHHAPYVGFPAHAGMDPSYVERWTPRLGLPRTRGDGPARRRRPPLVWAAPPHTRGWTPAPRVTVPYRRGSPAHAGMDPIHRLEADRRQRLPRTRGDGPRQIRA